MDSLPLFGGGSTLGDILPPPTYCPAFPQVSTTRRSKKFVFLREIGGCSCLQAYLNSAAGANSVVVIDTTCVLNAPLYIPPGRTVRGCGLYGAGILQFNGLNPATPAITMSTPFNLGLSTALEDIQISRVPAANAANGVAVSIDSDRCVLRNVRINNSHADTDFFPHVTVGIAGTANARNVIIDHVQIIGAVVGMAVNGPNWRIRHPFIRDSLAWGIRVYASAPDVMIESGRFEDNGDRNLLAISERGAIWTESSGTVVLHNYLEQNGWNPDALFQGTAVCITPAARRARIIANFIAADHVVFGNTAVDKGAEDELPPYLYPTMFSGEPDDDYAASPELLPWLADRHHILAFNMLDDHDGTHVYPFRALLVGSLNAPLIQIAP